MFCNAIFGIFCVTLPMGTSTAAIQNMGMGGVVSVTTPAWYASLGMGTDAPQTLNPAKISKLCVNGSCIAYWRHCAPAQDGKEIDCDFSFVEGATSITAGIIADNQAAMDQGLASVGYLQDRAKPDAAIALSQFVTESPVAQPPVCNPYSDTPPDKGCPVTQPTP
ncbi:MAG TPA: hypothetical protein VIJ85_12510 [Rhizomicrobium sp.]